MNQVVMSMFCMDLWISIGNLSVMIMSIVEDNCDLCNLLGLIFGSQCTWFGEKEFM
ncbi:hypothetical protein M758_7G116300 [Ceratodon purpureus]|nr:hypothetical protein M758_7G116300 [Ceratodon purpureus]